jgi:PAS domain S-box-containing protein
MFGYTAEEAIGKSVTMLLPADRIDEEPRILERLKRGERIEHYETVRVHKEGTLHHVSLSVSPIHDAQGRIMGASKISRDISDRIRARDALRESEQRFRTVADAAPVLIWESGLDKLCIYFNKAWLDFVGRPLEEELGNRWAENVHPEDRDGCLRIYSTFFEAQQPFEMELRMRHCSGEYRWILNRGVPRFSPNGVFLGFIGGCTDIHDQKRAKEHLEQLVAERTSTLQESLGELEAFSYSISHDMRAPLRAIQSFARILADDCGEQVSDDGKEYIRRIISAAHRMDRLIQDVLTYSQVARTELPMAPLNPEKLLRDILESYPDLQAPAANIQLEGPFASVVANEAVLTQCVSNLLTNAVKFVEPGVIPQVRIWAETAGNNGVVRLLFKDNGLGIPKESHDTIFGIFQRVSNRYQGTGIGLSIVKKGAERMGGAVGLESEPGRGSTFWLELKRADDPAP